MELEILKPCVVTLHAGDKVSVGESVARQLLDLTVARPASMLDLTPTLIIDDIIMTQSVAIGEG